MIGNSMLTALILSTHLRPRLNMYVCFLQREKMLQSSREKNHVLGHGAFRVPKAARVYSWMGIPEVL